MMNFKKLILFLLFSSLLMSMHHPFYVATFEVEYKSKSKEIGIACKLFPDDFEETLRIFKRKKFNLESVNKTEINQAITEYFNAHFAIKTDGKARPMQFLGYEIDKEVVWIYFAIEKLPAIKSIELTTDLMYEYKKEQTNIVHMNWDNHSQSFRLTMPEKKIIFGKP